MTSDLASVVPDKDILSARLRRDRALIAVALVVVWEGVIRFGVIDTLFLASPSQVWRAMMELGADPVIIETFLNTVKVLAIAFVVGSGLAVLVGAWLGLVPRAYRTFLPFVSVAMSTPKMIFLPLVIVIFGIGDLSKIVYGGMSAFFFTIPNISAAVRMLDHRLHVAIESLGASRRQRFVHFVVPGSLPGVVTGLWYGLKHALLSVLVAELFVSQSGIGFWINRYTSSFQVDKVFALILGLSVIAVALGWLFRAAEKRLDRWRPTGAQQ